MKTTHLWTVNLLLISALGDLSSSLSVRSRRSISEFGDMIRKHVQREALLYNSYGNFCGAGSPLDNDTIVPVDEVDRCCLGHDLCYRATRTAECADSWLGPYFARYSWEHSDGNITCGDDPDTCGRALCDCDKSTCECFAQHPYNETYKHPSIWDWLA